MSGYSKTQRYNTIKGPADRYRGMSDDFKLGNKESIYRSGDQIREAKATKMD